MANSLIRLDESASVSKYRQIVNSILNAIRAGELKVGDQMPSINNVCNEWNLSRDTVLAAYNELKAKGVLSSAPGKGYYIESINIDLTHKVFVLFDELNSFKEDLYTSFIDTLGDNAQVELYFHHFNRKQFDMLLKENNSKYTTYVIMPAKFEGIAASLRNLSGRVVVLDQLPADLGDEFPAIYQNFEKDVYRALSSGRELLKKYSKLIMVYPGGKEPEGQYKGFLKFCSDAGVAYELISDVRDRNIVAGEAYIAIADRDLIHVVKKCKEACLPLGESVGLISYNDTSLKEIVANGITTISTDFKEMGATLANLVLSKKSVQVENPSALIIRGSL